MNRPQIVFLVNKISRATGGVSSILDLIQTTNEVHGDSIKVYSLKSRLMQRLRQWVHPASLGLDDFEDVRILRQVRMLPRCARRKSAFGFVRNIGQLSHIRTALLNNCDAALSFLETSEKKFWRDIKEAKIIVDAATLCGNFVQQLRKRTNAVIVRNHAASPTQLMNRLSLDRAPGVAVDRRELYSRFCYLYDGLLFQAEDQINEFRRVVPDYPGATYLLEPSCKEESVMRASREPTPFDTEFNIVMVGSIQKRKGHDFAIPLMRKLHSKGVRVHLHIVGGRLTSKFGQEVVNGFKEEGLDKCVSFYGYRSDYLKYLAHADLVLSLSRMEGASRVIREALCLGKPVVAFDISGTAALLGNEAGILIEAFRVSEMAAQIPVMVSFPEKRIASGQAARSRYEEKYSKAAYMERWSALVSEILELQKRRRSSFGVAVKSDL